LVKLELDFLVPLKYIQTERQLLVHQEFLIF
jgi:hypothetical protein